MTAPRLAACLQNGRLAAEKMLEAAKHEIEHLTAELAEAHVSVCGCACAGWYGQLPSSCCCGEPAARCLLRAHHSAPHHGFHADCLLNLAHMPPCVCRPAGGGSRRRWRRSRGGGRMPRPACSWLPGMHRRRHTARHRRWLTWRRQSRWAGAGCVSLQWEWGVALLCLGDMHAGRSACVAGWGAWLEAG
jgi:hypothetical protein